MKVKLLKDKNYHPEKYKAGQVAEIPNNVADRWIRRGVACLLKDGVFSYKKPSEYNPSPKVSIIVLVKDALKYVKKCIESIALHTQNYELIIVDNGSSKKTKEYLSNIDFIDYTLITNKENKGVSYGWNQGIKIAKHDLLCFINSDCVVTKNWVRYMAEGFDYLPNVGIVGPSTCRTIKMQTIPESFGKYDVEDASIIDHYGEIAPKAFKVTRLVAFCWIVKREVFDKIGVFDHKRYGLAWHEDCDFTWRVNKAGYNQVWATASYVHHFGGKTTTEMKLDQKLKGENEKKLNLRKKLKDIYIPNDVIIGSLEKKKVKVSIVILVKDALEYFQQCLESVVKHTDSYELIIVDNGSGKTTKKYIEAQKEKLGFKLITNDVNKGFAYGCNQGIKVSTCRHVCFLNSDCVVTKDWLTRLMAGFNLPEAGLLGPSTSWASSKQMLNYCSKIRFNMSPKRIDDVVDRLDTGYEEEPNLVGFCFLTTKDVLEKVGGFDYKVSPIAYYDDVDFRRRVINAGYKCYWIKGSYVHHYGHRTAVESKINSRKTTAEALERLKAKDPNATYFNNDVIIKKKAILK